MFDRLVTSVRSWNRKRRNTLRTKRAARTVDTRDTLAVICMVKNESRAIEEWIDHYLWQGADHLFIIDNASTDDTVDRIDAKAAATGKITRLSRPKRHSHHTHLQDVFQSENIAARFKWVLPADADEFWYAPRGGRIVDALARLDDFDLIYCNWATFGALKGDQHPASLRKDLVWRQPDLGPHKYSKWVAKTDALGGGAAIRLHRIDGVSSERTVTETATLAVNHYITQSKSFWFDIKMTRGDAVDPALAAKRDGQMFEDINKACTVEDRRLADLVARHEAGETKGLPPPIGVAAW